MAKRSKIIICIFIAIACVTCCFLPIVASADSFDDASVTPCVPTLYGLYGNGLGYSYSTSIGGFPSKIPTVTGTRNTTYRYCYQTSYETTRHPNLWGYYDDSLFGNDRDAIYYGILSTNENTPSYTFACYDSSFKIFFDYFKFATSADDYAGAHYWNIDTSFNMEYSAQFYNIDDGSIVTKTGTLYYSDYIEMVDGVWSDGLFWIGAKDFIDYIYPGYSDDAFPLLNVTLSSDYARDDVFFICYFMIEDASTYISSSTYRKNLLHLGYEYGFESGYDVGYALGYNYGDALGYERGYDKGTQDGYNDGYASGEDAGYQTGKQDGYNDGYASGEDAGYQIGFADGSEFEDKGFWSLLVDTVDGFLSFKIFGEFTFMNLLSIVIAVPLLVWILKLFAGG